MDAIAMGPEGLALLAYVEGDRDAELVIHRDDGVDDPMPVGYFFRKWPDFDSIDREAIERCQGRVLDVGAGTGVHSLVLQERGLRVTAIDIVPESVAIMTQHGVNDAQCVDVFTFHAGPFDTMLLLGHGIGMVETVAGLDRFLSHAQKLVSKDGQVLLDSVDVRQTEDPRYLAYHEANRRAGRYIGEIRLQLEFQGQKGPLCGWLHVDAETLSEHAASANWQTDVLLREKNGHYLARLTKT